jgi:hypothetical protein
VIELEFAATVFRAEDGDAWHFVELDEALTEVVDRFTGGPTGGWQSVKVDVEVGSTRWRTSLFLSTDGTYLLPVKKDVRRAESIEAGDEVLVTLRL